jgi:hypothetical protein
MAARISAVLLFVAIAAATFVIASMIPHKPAHSWRLVEIAALALCAVGVWLMAAGKLGLLKRG